LKSRLSRIRLQKKRLHVIREGIR